MSPTLTLSEAAERLDVAPRTLQRWCRDGLVAHTRLPSGRVRIPEDEIDRLLAVQPARNTA